MAYIPTWLQTSVASVCKTSAPSNINFFFCTSLEYPGIKLQLLSFHPRFASLQTIFGAITPKNRREKQIKYVLVRHHTQHNNGTEQYVFSDCTKIKQVEGVFSRFSVAPRGFSVGVPVFPCSQKTNSRCDVYMFFTIQINLYPFILLSVRFPHTVKYWARLHRAAMTNVRKGSFQKLELALTRAFSRGTHRLPKQESLLAGYCQTGHFVNEIGFFQEFLLKNVFIRACYQDLTDLAGQL